MREDTLVCRDADPLFGPFFIKSCKAYTLYSISSACSRRAHAVGRRVSLGPQLTPQTPIRSALPPHAGGTEEGGSMVYVSARALEEELRHLEEERAAARNLEHSTAERHAEEGSQETEAVLQARKIQAEHLEAEREGLVAELRRRAVAEAGQPRLPSCQRAARRAERLGQPCPDQRAGSVVGRDQHPCRRALSLRHPTPRRPTWAS